MNECYQRWQCESTVEAMSEGAAADRVRTSYPQSLDVLQETWLKAFDELGFQKQSSAFDKSSAGAVTVTNAIDASRGERSHAGTAFLEPTLKRQNVKLRTDAYVDKIIFDDARHSTGKLTGKGVRYVHDGQHYTATARHELILCAGVFGSPAILERSGIGSRDVLSAATIPVLVDLRGIGENLQDHLNCSISVEVQDSIPTGDEAARSPEMQRVASEEYRRSRTGPLAEGPAYSFAFAPLHILRDSLEEQELLEMVDSYVKVEKNSSVKAQHSIIQDIINSHDEATATLLMIRQQRHPDADSLPGDAPPIVAGNYVSLVAMLSHPFSRGSCHISSSDCLLPPSIKFNYFSHPLDAEVLARHMVQIERLLSEPAFSSIRRPHGKRLPRSFPQPISSVVDAKRMLPTCSATNYHPCGTCAMMKQDLGGVVDEALRVYGTENVRVCDASVLPIIPRGNILTAVYAFAEKAAELIYRDAEARAGDAEARAADR